MQYFFVTGMGRSGSKFLSTLLQANDGICAKHEFIGNREFALLTWYLEGQDYTFQYLKRAKREIDKDMRQCHTFIDVNGGLRNSVPELFKVFKPTRIYHLVRNPKKVVRSIFIRRNEMNIHEIPKEKANIEWWLDANKFSRICWNWKNTTEKLLSQNTCLIKFEEIIFNYEYCYEKLLKP